MTIDAHTHVHPDRDGWSEGCDASLDNLVSSLDECKVDKAVILPIAPKVSNAFVKQCCDKHPNRLIGFASVNPLDGFQAVEKLEKDVHEYGLKGLKLHPRVQNFKVNDPQIVPVIQKASDMKIPVIIDTLLHGPTLLKDNVPLLVDELARAVPEAKIVMAHMGGYKFMDALFVAKVNRNVYLELSVTLLYFANSPFEEQIGFVIQRVGPERCIYGSDHPTYIASEAFYSSVKVLEKYSLTGREIDYILGNTMASLLS